MEMLRVDLFTEIVELLPPVFLHRNGNFHCVSVPYDAHWHKCQGEDWGRTEFVITFYLSEDRKVWEFEVSHGEGRYPVELIVDTLRRLPRVRSVTTDFIHMHVSDYHAAITPGPEAVSDHVPLRRVMFHKAYFDNPNGGRPYHDWAIRVGKRVIDD